MMLQNLFALLIGHAFGDFVFQTEFISRHKNRHVGSVPPPGQRQQKVWLYVLTAHALVHGGITWTITGSLWLALAETVLHWVIDFGKCEGWYGIHRDQAMHIGCKVAYAAVMA